MREMEASFGCVDGGQLCESGGVVEVELVGRSPAAAAPTVASASLAQA